MYRLKKSIRHTDGIKEIGRALIEKIKSAIERFKQMGTGRKIVYLLGHLLSIASAIMAAKSYSDNKVGDLVRKFMRAREQVQKVGWDYIKADYGNSGLIGKNYMKFKHELVTKGLKVILYLAGSFIALVSGRIAAGGKVGDNAIRHNDSILESIAEKMKSLTGALVSQLKTLAATHPEYAVMLSVATKMYALWDSVEGVKDIGDAFKKAWARLFNQLTAQQKRYYTGKAILGKLISGIGKIGIAFFKVWASKKMLEYSRYY